MKRLVTLLCLTFLTLVVWGCMANKATSPVSNDSLKEETTFESPPTFDMAIESERAMPGASKSGIVARKRGTPPHTPHTLPPLHRDSRPPTLMTTASSTSSLSFSRNTKERPTSQPM